MICSCCNTHRCDSHSTMLHYLRNTKLWAHNNVWALSDAYGGIKGYMPIQGMDWSGVRDSSPQAVEAMYKKAKEINGDN